MIHDVIAETLPELTLPKRLPRLFWKAKTALGRWQASALATVSEHSRQGIVEYFHVDPKRVFVVGEASDPIFRVLDDLKLPPTLQASASSHIGGVPSTPACGLNFSTTSET